LEKGEEPYYIRDEYFEGEPFIGGKEELSRTALQHWKKANEPEITEQETPLASPQVHYRESADLSGESNKEDDKNPFSEEEKEEESQDKLEYAPGTEDVVIPTVEQ